MHINNPTEALISCLKGHHFVRISKVCVYFQGLCFIKSKCAYFEGACLFCLKNELCFGKTAVEM